jgi:putative endopeptidase
MQRIATVLVSVLAACGAKPTGPQQPTEGSTGGSTEGSIDRPAERMAGLDKRLIDTTADPCTDFFQYACGNFSKLYPIPPDRPSFGTGSMLKEYTDHALHEILEHAAQPRAGRTPNEQKIGDAYASCMDQAAIDHHGLAVIQPELDRIAALTAKDQLPELLAHDQLIGVNALFGFGEQQDFGDARKQIAVIGQGGLGLPERDYYLRTGAEPEKTRAEYLQHVTRTLALLGDGARAADEARAILAFETELAKLSLDITSQRDPRRVYHLMPVTELAALTPGFAWPRFFAATGAPAFTELNVSNPEFFRGVHALVAATDLPTLKTYLRWQLIAAIPGTSLPRALDAEQFAFNGHVLSGALQERPRWKRCVEVTDGELGEAVGEVYVARQFSPANKAATLQMVRDIEAAMDADIATLDWMSAETKARAKQKLRAVADKIGYPDRWRDYGRLTIVRDDAYGNAIRAGEFEARRQLA